jgi:hypothetical protein
LHCNFEKVKLPRSEQITAEFIQAGGGTLLSVIHKLINNIWNKEELPDQQKESIIVLFHRKDVKTAYNNYFRISVLSTSYKRFS